ncbi:MAG: type II toxin-antitoxin system RelE/ParE family toxin [Gemmatimonadetes bacterium]|nr:type II toxin-antitoxin system RelE/ParE family toxin [Gemmatimonadota bacterium]
MGPEKKPVVWLSGEVKSPPFSPGARREAGEMLRRLQWGESLSLPHSRPMPGIGPGCHELRIMDEDKSWRIIYRIHRTAIVVADVFQKTTQATPVHVIVACKRRLRRYDEETGGA